MNSTEAHAMHEPVSETILNRIAVGSVTEGVGAIAAIALSIVGLAGVYTAQMAAIATIVVGAVILSEGGFLRSSYRKFYSAASGEWHAMEQGGGVTAEFFGGLTGIVLGILAFFRPTSVTLLAVAVLVYGAALLLSAATAPRTYFRTETAGQQSSEALAATDPGGQLLVGLGTIVLGILAVIGLVPATLILVGLLSLGAAALFSGSMAPGKPVSAPAR